MGVGQEWGGECLACPGPSLSRTRFLALASLLKGTPSWLELRSLNGKMERTALDPDWHRKIKEVPLCPADRKGNRGRH